MKIESVELKAIAVRESQYPENNLTEFLLVGRSNVGKSSFINALSTDALSNSLTNKS